MQKLSQRDRIITLIVGLIIGIVLGATFHKETVVVREGTADTPAALSSVNLMIDYGNGSVRTWNTVSWHEAMSVLDLMNLVAGTKNITMVTSPAGGTATGILSIDGIENDPKAGTRWQFWVDNVYEPKTANKYYLKPGDIIVWKFAPEQKH